MSRVLQEMSTRATLLCRLARARNANAAEEGLHVACRVKRKGESEGLRVWFLDCGRFCYEPTLRRSATAYSTIPG